MNANTRLKHVQTRLKHVQPWIVLDGSGHFQWIYPDRLYTNPWISFTALIWVWFTWRRWWGSQVRGTHVSKSFQLKGKACMCLSRTLFCWLILFMLVHFIYVLCRFVLLFLCLLWGIQVCNLENWRRGKKENKQKKKEREWDLISDLGSLINLEIIDALADLVFTCWMSTFLAHIKAARQNGFTRNALCHPILFLL